MTDQFPINCAICKEKFLGKREYWFQKQEICKLCHLWITNKQEILSRECRGCGKKIPPEQSMVCLACSCSYVDESKGIKLQCYGCNEVFTIDDVIYCNSCVIDAVETP